MQQALHPNKQQNGFHTQEYKNSEYFVLGLSLGEMTNLHELSLPGRVPSHLSYAEYLNKYARLEDATTNDIPNDFEVKDYPTLYFYSASGQLVKYDGGRVAEDILSFIQKNRDGNVEPDLA